MRYKMRLHTKLRLAELKKGVDLKKLENYILEG